MKTRSCNVVLCILVFVLSAVSVLFPGVIEGSEFRAHTRVVLSEEYNDNVLLATKETDDDYITRVAPSLSLVYRAATWDWNLSYDYQYRYYARATLDDESTHALDLTNSSRIIKGYLFLDVKDHYKRVSLDVLRDYTQESNYVNQSDMNLLTVNPYLVVAPSSQMTVTAGYIFRDTWYKDPVAIDRTDHIGYVDLRRDLSPRTAMTAGIRHTLDLTATENYTQDDLSLGINHEYADNSTLTVKAGNSWFAFEKPGRTEKTSQVFWEAVLNQRFPTVTVIYETGLRYIQDPLQSQRREDRYLVTIRKDVERNSIVLSGGLMEYRNAENKHLETTRYRVMASVRHALTTRSQINLDVAAERLRDYPSGTFEERYLTGARFEQLVMEELTLALDYRFTNVYSPEVYSNNYVNNRYTVELRKVF